jgi:hypothetical protein
MFCGLAKILKTIEEGKKGLAAFDNGYWKGILMELWRMRRLGAIKFPSKMV